MKIQILHIRIAEQAFFYLKEVIFYKYVKIVVFGSGIKKAFSGGQGGEIFRKSFCWLKIIVMLG